MSKDMPSTMISSPEAESGDMVKVVDKDMGKDRAEDTVAVAECRLIGRKQPPMIGQIVGG